MAAKTPLDDPSAVQPQAAPSVPTSYQLQSTRERQPAVVVGPAFKPSDLPPRAGSTSGGADKSPLSILMREDLLRGVPNVAVAGGALVGGGLLFWAVRRLLRG